MNGLYGKVSLEYVKFGEPVLMYPTKFSSGSSLDTSAIDQTTGLPCLFSILAGNIVFDLRDFALGKQILVKSKYKVVDLKATGVTLPEEPVKASIVAIFGDKTCAGAQLEISSTNIRIGDTCLYAVGAEKVEIQYEAVATPE